MCDDCVVLWLVGLFVSEGQRRDAHKTCSSSVTSIFPPTKDAQRGKFSYLFMQLVTS